MSAAVKRLRRAASEMRSRAEGVIAKPQAERLHGVDHLDYVCGTTTANHLAGWKPGVAILLSEWLDAVADDWDTGPCDAEPGPCNHCERNWGYVAALEFASAYLGGAA